MMDGDHVKQAGKSRDNHGNPGFIVHDKTKTATPWIKVKDSEEYSGNYDKNTEVKCETTKTALEQSYESDKQIGTCHVFTAVKSEFTSASPLFSNPAQAPNASETGSSENDGFIDSSSRVKIEPTNNCSDQFSDDCGNLQLVNSNVMTRLYEILQESENPVFKNLVHSSRRKKSELPAKPVQSKKGKVPSGKRPSCQCSVCNKEFTKPSLLKRHTIIHTGERPYGCEVCEKRFNNPAHLKTHMRLHTGEKPFQCTICSKAFPTKGHLRYHSHTGQKPHTTSHTRQRPHTCSECDKGFTSKSALMQHFVIHTGERAYICKVCSKDFNNSGNLKKHLLTHQEQKPYICEICGKQFVDKGNFKVHCIRHTGEKNFACNKCDFAFFTAAELKRHSIKHCDVKPFSCEYCGRGFNDTYNLKVHIRIHTGEKPHRCEICGKAFPRSYSKVKHMRTHVSK